MHVCFIIDIRAYIYGFIRVYRASRALNQNLAGICTGVKSVR